MGEVFFYMWCPLTAGALCYVMCLLTAVSIIEYAPLRGKYVPVEHSILYKCICLRLWQDNVNGFIL